MLFLKERANNKKCKTEIDYYVPFTISIEDENVYSAKSCWRTGNLKNSLVEIEIDKESGILRNITLTSVDKAFLVNTTLKNVDEIEYGTPILFLDGDIKNGICDEPMNIYVYLGLDYIMVKFGEDVDICEFIELERARFGFDKDNKLASIVVKNLSNYEYNELKEGLKL